MLIDFDRAEAFLEARHREIRELTAEFGGFPNEVQERLAETVASARAGFLQDHGRMHRDRMSHATLEHAKQGQRSLAEVVHAVQQAPEPLRTHIIDAAEKRDISPEAMDRTLEALIEGLSVAETEARTTRESLNGRPLSTEAHFTREVDLAVEGMGLNRSRRAELVRALMEAVPFEPLPSKETIYQRLRNKEQS